MATFDGRRRHASEKLLESEIEATGHAAEGLVKLVEKDELGGRPSTGSNWMTTGQLLAHMTNACGMCRRGFVTGDWGMPAGADAGTMLSPAATMPSVKSVDEALKLLAEDRKLARKMVADAGEKNLAAKRVAAPWDPRGKPLGQAMLPMVGHLAQPKGQLFCYLELQGKPAHTGHLDGM